MESHTRKLKSGKAVLLLALWSFLLYSCKEVSFRVSQPEGVSALKEVPAALRGYYQINDNHSGEHTDTLIIESWGYHFTDQNDKDWLGKGTLSDSLVVKFYQDYYFVNFKVGDQWVLRLIRQKASGDIEFLSIDLEDENKRKEILKKFSKGYGLKEIKKNEDTFYQINPTPAQLIALIKDGYFTGDVIQKVVR